MSAIQRLDEILKYNSGHGVQESNPLLDPKYHEIEREYVDFDDLKRSDKIELERLRLVTDAGFPMYDVSYIYVTINGQPAQLLDFPSQLPKRGFKSYLINLCKKKGIFIKDLVNMGKISILR